MANTSAIAVSAFSPPDSRWMVLFFLPGGCAITCTPASRISSPVITSRAVPPPNRLGNMRPKCSLTWLKVWPAGRASRGRSCGSRLRACSIASLQVGVLRVEEGLALARRGQLVQRRQVDRAERGDLAVEAVDLALQAPQLDAAVARCPAPAPRRSTCAAVSCSRYCAPPSCAACCFELQLGDAARAAAPGCARCVRRCSSARAQLGAQVVVLAARVRASACSRSQLAAPARSAARPARRHRSSAASSSSSCARGLHVGRHLLLRRSRSRAAARRGAPASVRDWNCASCAWRSSARSCSRAASSCALGGDAPPRRARRGAPARRPAAGRVPRSAPRRRRGARRSVVELRVDLGQFVVELARAAPGWPRPAASGAAARPAVWWARVCASAASRRAADQALRGFGVGRLGAHAARCAPRRRSGPARACWRSRFSISCCARQHAGLLGIGRVEAHRELRHRMAFARHDDFAVRQLAARGQRLVEAGARCRRLRASR